MAQESGSIPLTAQVAVGQQVTTSDGETLGEVKEITSKQFQVKATHGRDFWLDRQAVVGAEASSITVGFPAEELPTYRLANRDADAKEPVTAPTTDTAGMPEEEIARQREVMERELAVQRERLHHAKPRDATSPPNTGGTYGEPVESELAREEHVPVQDVIDRARADARVGEAVPLGKASASPLRDVKDLEGMHVLAAEGRDLGTVKDVLFDPEQRAVLGLLVAADEGAQIYIGRGHIHGFGGEEVMVDGASDLDGDSGAAPGVAAAGGVHLDGMRVMTERGEAVGKLDKVLLDDSGKIAGYHATSGLFGLGGKTDISPGDVVSIGSDTLVVRDTAGKHAT